MLEEINKLLDEITDHYEKATLTPQEAFKYSAILSHYLSDLGDKLAFSEGKCAEIWATIRDTTETDGRADKLLRAKPAYLEKRLYELKWKAVNQMLQTLKKRMASFETEVRNMY